MIVIYSLTDLVNYIEEKITRTKGHKSLIFQENENKFFVSQETAIIPKLSELDAKENNKNKNKDRITEER